MLTGTVGRASKRSLIVRFTVSGQVPCPGAERRGKVLDAVSTAILGGVAAENVALQRARFFAIRCKSMVRSSYLSLYINFFV